MAALAQSIHASFPNREILLAVLSKLTGSDGTTALSHQFMQAFVMGKFCLLYFLYCQAVMIKLPWLISSCRLP